MEKTINMDNLEANQAKRENSKITRTGFHAEILILKKF